MYICIKPFENFSNKKNLLKLERMKFVRVKSRII